MASFAERFKGKTSIMTQQGLNGILQEGDQPINKAGVRITGDLPIKPRQNELISVENFNANSEIQSNSGNSKFSRKQNIDSSSQYVSSNGGGNKFGESGNSNFTQNNMGPSNSNGYNQNIASYKNIEKLASGVSTGQSYFQQNNDFTSNQQSPAKDPYLVFNPFNLDSDASHQNYGGIPTGISVNNFNSTNPLYSQPNIPRSDQIPPTNILASPNQFSNYTSAKNLVGSNHKEELNLTADQNYEEDYSPPPVINGNRRNINPANNKNNYVPSMGDQAAVRKIVSGGSLPHRNAKKETNKYSKENTQQQFAPPKYATGNLRYDGSVGVSKEGIGERQNSNRIEDIGNGTYKPYTMAEYKDIKVIPTTNGGLGPNTGTDEWMKKQEKVQKMQEFAQQVKYINSQNLPVSNQRKIRREEPKEKTSREQALEFAKNIPQPKVRPKEEIYQMEEEEVQAFGGNRETDIQKLEKQHFDYLNQIENLKIK